MAEPPSLSLPASLRLEAEQMAASDGASLDQFVAVAVAEKVAALRVQRLLRERRGRADWDAFDRLMARAGGEPPREGDEVSGPGSPGSP